MLKVILEPLNNKYSANVYLIIEEKQFADFCMSIKTDEYRIVAKTINDNSVFYDSKTADPKTKVKKTNAGCNKSCKNQQKVLS